MKNNLKDILSHTHKELEDQQLMDYLSGKLKQNEMHDLETQMLEDPFLEEAMEGLSTLPSSNNVNATIASLKKNLQHQIQKKKKSRLSSKDHFWTNLVWTYIAILVILITLLVSFFIIKLY